MKDEKNATPVPTEVTVRATASVDEEVANDLALPDPSPEKASAALREALENKDKNRREG